MLASRHLQQVTGRPTPWTCRRGKQTQHPFFLVAWVLFVPSLLILSLIELGCGRRKDAPIAAGSATSSSPSAWFEDVSDRDQVKFIHDAGPIGEYFFPQIQGSG